MGGAPLDARILGEAVFGLFPHVRRDGELTQRTPRGKRKQKPMHRHQPQNPRSAREPSPRKAQPAQQRGGGIAANQVYKIEGNRRCGYRFCPARKALPDCNSKSADEQRMYQRSKYVTADDELKCPKALPAHVAPKP